MKAITVIVLLALSLSSMASTETTLKACLVKTYSAAAQANGDSKGILKFVADDVKACKASVKDAVKLEKTAKRVEKIKAQIAKLQSKLTAN